MEAKKEGKLSGKFYFPMYVDQSCMEQDLDILELTPRSINCLRRAGYRTVKDVIKGIVRIPGDKKWNLKFHFTKKNEKPMSQKMFKAI